jgi:hypothetical protein
MRVWISIKPQEVKLWFTCDFVHAIGRLLLTCKGKARAISILVGVEEYVRAVIFVVTGKSAMYCE